MKKIFYLSFFVIFFCGCTSTNALRSQNNSLIRYIATQRVEYESIIRSQHSEFEANMRDQRLEFELIIRRSENKISALEKENNLLAQINHDQRLVLDAINSPDSTKSQLLEFQIVLEDLRREHFDYQGKLYGLQLRLESALRLFQSTTSP